MSEQQNLALLQEFYAALKRGDVTGLLNTLADDVAWFVPAPKTLSRWSGNARARGRSCRSSRSFWRCKMQISLISRVRSPGRQGDRTRTLPLAHKVERAIL